MLACCILLLERYILFVFNEIAMYCIDSTFDHNNKLADLGNPWYITTVIIHHLLLPIMILLNVMY